MEVIEFLDDSGKILVKRMPDNGQLEIKWGSQLTVRESQEAIFFRDGKALDVFGPGRHILETQNIPVISKWVTKFGYGPNSPFRAEVLFVGKQLFPNLKWGTKESILFRDTELQMVRLRAYGSFSIQINDAMLFVNKVVGTMGLYSTFAIEDYLRGVIISKFNVVLGRVLKSVFDIPITLDQLNLVMRSELSADFEGLGLSLHDFYVQSVTVPDEVQKMIDTRTGMNAVGNLDQYMKLKIADSLGDAAKNQGEVGSAMGLGAGMGMGMMLPNMIQQSVNGQSSESVTDKLKQLKELLDLGALTQVEFDEKKERIIKTDMSKKNKGLKYEVYQTTSQSNKTYIIHRYYDDKNSNYEYQIYELVNSKAAANECGISDIKEGRAAQLNTREVCELLIKKIKNE